MIKTKMNNELGMMIQASEGRIQVYTNDSHDEQNHIKEHDMMQ